jgi:hypothetical protein
MDDSRISQQGPWHDLKQKDDISLQALLKTEKSPRDTLADIAERTVAKIQAQERLAQDLAVDASRKTGDFSLYSKVK